MVFQKEVCYALLGYTGRVVIERDDGFELAPGLPLVCESEYKLVRRLVELGYFYSRLERYVSDKLYQGYLSKKHSAYIRAFAMGLEESLTPYRARVLQLEQQLIRNPALSLPQLQIGFGEYELVLPALRRILEEIETSRLTGVALLDYLHDTSVGCAPTMRAYMAVVRAPLPIPPEDTKPRVHERGPAIPISALEPHHPRLSRR